MECPICLEIGGTECAPCGFADAALFHSHCLEAHYNGGGLMCPHCNVKVPSLGLARLRCILDEWLDTPGLWRRTPLFVPLQRGLMRETIEEDALRKVIEHAVSAMLLSCAKRNEENIIFASRCGDTKRLFVMFHCTNPTANDDSSGFDYQQQHSNNNNNNELEKSSGSNTSSGNCTSSSSSSKKQYNHRNHNNNNNNSLRPHHEHQTNNKNNRKRKKGNDDEITEVVLQRSVISSFESDSIMALTSCDDGYILSASRKRIVKKKKT